MTDKTDLLLTRFRNGVLLEAQKRKMPLWTMIKHYKLPLSLQSVFQGKNCLVSTMEETAKGLGLDVCELLAMKPLKQKTAPAPKRKGSISRNQRDEIAA